MALEGFLQEFGLADIIQLIYFQRKTGILSIKSATDRIALSFINGNISKLESQTKTEDKKLGRILIKKGLITQDDLDGALKMQKREGVVLGNIFMKQGLLSKDVLQEIVHGQIIETIAHIFTWREGRYEFTPQEIPVDRELPISLDTQHLLMDGLRIVDDWTLIEGKLDLNTIFKKGKEPEPDQLDDVEESVLSLIDEETDVSTIINVCSSEDIETIKALISLEEKGIIEPIVIKSFEEERKVPVNVHVKISEQMCRIVVIAIAIFIGFFAFRGNLDVFGVFKQTRIVSEIERLKTQVDIYNITNGRYPEHINTITTKKDAWGKPFIYRLTENNFKIFSSGPDGIEGTEDDIY